MVKAISEAEKQAKLRGNPLIVEYYEAYNIGNNFFIHSEYVEGKNLEILL